MTSSLCDTCRYMREVVSGKGSRFRLCRLSQTDRRYAKYPPQPVVQCDGYEPHEMVFKPDTHSRQAG